MHAVISDNLRYAIIVGVLSQWKLVHWNSHDDVIKWKQLPRYWPFVRGIHRSPVNSPHKGQWRGALMLSLTCAWINGWVNNDEAGDLTRYRAHYDVTVMYCEAHWSTHRELEPSIPVFLRCGGNLKLIIQNNSLGTRHEISARWMPRNPTKEWSALVQVMVPKKPITLISLSLSGSGNGLVPWGSKPLAKPVLTQIYDDIWCH